MNQDSFIKELGRSYIVSSLLPAAFFCLILILLFQRLIPVDYFEELSKKNILILGQWLLMAIVPIWIGFLLFSSVDWIVKIYEGYFFPDFLKESLKILNRIKLRKKIENYQLIKDILSKDNRSDDDEEAYFHRIDNAIKEVRNLEINSPIDESDIMPTRLGNVLRASEIYASDRYRIEAVNIWPRLFSILPNQFLKDMEEKNNHFMFLLNSSLILYISSCLCLMMWIAGFFIDTVQDSQIYFLASIILASFGYVLYRISVNAARDFGYFYRAGFDLYRMELLRHLNIILPSDLTAEQNLWVEISDFLAVGDKLAWDTDNFTFPPYHFHKINLPTEKKSKEDPKSKTTQQ